MMDRRAFLGIASIGALGASSRRIKSAATDKTLEQEVEESGKYQLLKRLDQIDEIFVEFGSDRTNAFELNFSNDDTTPESDKALVIPKAYPDRGFHVHGPVDYEISMWPPSRSHGATALIRFSSTTPLRVYAHVDRQKEIVVLTGG